jgi:hypothetical protein
VVEVVAGRSPDMEPEKLWDELGVKCDGCGGSVYKDKWDRPWQRKDLARAGYANALCKDCDEKHGEMLSRFFLRVAGRVFRPQKEAV